WGEARGCFGHRRGLWSQRSRIRVHPCGESSGHWIQAMRFPYRRYAVEETPSRPGLTVIHRPVIRIRLQGDSRASHFYALLDSGADETFLPKSMADVIGVTTDLFPSATASTASGEMPVAYGVVTIEL